MDRVREKPLSLGDLRLKAAQADIVEGMLARKSILCLFAKAGEGKSIVVHNLIVQLASGQPIWGLFPVERPCRVLLLDAEMNDRELMDRLGPLFDRFGKQFEENLRMEILRGDGYIDITRPEVQNWLNSCSPQFKPDVVVFDPLSGFHRCPENDNVQMRIVLDSIKTIVDRFDAAGIVVHHTGHEYMYPDGTMAKPKERGASAIRDCVDVSISLTKYKNHPNVRRLSFEKKRSVHSTPLDEVFVQFDPDSLVIGPWELAETRQKAVILLASAVRFLKERYSTRKLGSLLGVSHAAVSRWGSGQRMPSDAAATRVLELAVKEGFTLPTATAGITLQPGNSGNA